MPLANVRIVANPGSPEHGMVGQDVLGATAAHVLDFQAMRFELLP